VSLQARELLPPRRSAERRGDPTELWRLLRHLTSSLVQAWRTPPCAKRCCKWAGTHARNRANQSVPAKQAWSGHSGMAWPASRAWRESQAASACERSCQRPRSRHPCSRRAPARLVLVPGLAMSWACWWRREEDVRNRMQHNLASLFDAHWAGLRARAGTTVSSNAALEHHQRLALTGSPAADANTAAGAW